jgi:starch-binding outer membrane protein, SusD/RagB family
MTRSLLPTLLLAATLPACTDLDLTDPNRPSTDTFWQTREHAIAGVNAAYNALLNNGAYGRWLVFATDLRSDIGMIQSPWTDLSNFTKFTFTSYDFEVNREIWQHHYQAIFRANQVIARVPGIAMDAVLRGRIVGEAKFIRALLYFNLVTLYGNVPLITTPPLPTDRPATAAPAAVWAQIEQDLTEARAVLPQSYGSTDLGRATWGAATALLGKAHLQQREWGTATAVLQEVISPELYDLMPSYADNFTAQVENDQESVFEVQFGDRSFLSAGVRGLNIARMVGPCGPSFCDGRPTRWYFEQFQQDSTVGGQADPRLDLTVYYNKPGGMDVYGRPFADRYSADPTVLFFKKYGEYYLGLADQDWDAAINFRVIRYADVLLMQAEALNELGRTPEAYPLVDRVRARVDLPPLPAGLNQDEMRERILRERMFELGLEGQRWADLQRHDRLAPALQAIDAEFQFFVAGKSELLPIPQTEIDLNPNARQNPNW